MSTRATYEFKGDQYRKDVTIYIHHDGYPAGAAFYLFRAWKNGGLTPEGMIRGNERAELTESHDAHGDTEYRYTLDDRKTLKVEERHTLIEFGSYPKGWRTIFAGDWVEFVNKHLDAKWLDGDKPILARLTLEHAEQVHTPETLAAQLAKDLQLLGQWSMGAYKDSPDAYNMVSLRARITLMQGVLAQYGPPAWRDAA